MSRTLSARAPQAVRVAAGRAAARPYWNPYGVGFLLGLVLLATYAVAGRGLGATAAFSATASWLAGIVVARARAGQRGAPALLERGRAAARTGRCSCSSVRSSAPSSRAGRAGGCRGRSSAGRTSSDNTRLLLAFGGGFIAAFGARIAKGCTSGQALTGGSMLNVGSLVFMLAVFASAYALAWFVRKEWL